jgi:glucuronate isomerase
VTLGSLVNGGPENVRAGQIEVIATCDNPWLPDPAALAAPVTGAAVNPFRLGMRIEPLAYPGKFVRIGGDSDPIAGLARVAGAAIETIQDYLDALETGVRRFVEYGNTSLDFSMWGDPQVYPVTDRRATEILRHACDGGTPEPEEERDFLAYMMPHFFRLAYTYKLPLQLKVGVIRNVNPDAPNNARDSVDPAVGLNGLVPLLREYEQQANKDGRDWAVILSVRNRYNYQQQADLASAFRIVYWGGDWWDNDNLEGMEEGLYQRARWRGGVYRGVMFFSDTRSFPDCLTRFDMKKRVLANYLSAMVESRYVAFDDAVQIGLDAFYNQPKRLFNV